MFFITDMPKPAAELFHNIHLYVRDDGVEMVEHHVDLMDVNERKNFMEDIAYAETLHIIPSTTPHLEQILSV